MVRDANCGAVVSGMSLNPGEGMDVYKPVLRGRNAMECHKESVEALENNALLYRTVARVAGKCLQRRASTSDVQRVAANGENDVSQCLSYYYGDCSRGLN
ncbi:hypothetical protein TNCV_1208011 [Trichonephila clavipes]|nr:hypothetical protein TNCV_1208011 [Trichonephila clavipes]